MNEDQKFWLSIVTVICISVLLLVCCGVAGCREVEKTNQTALQNGYQMDRGEWRKPYKGNQ